MPVHNQDSQFKFLIACIKHCSSPGKVCYTVCRELAVNRTGLIVYLGRLWSRG